MSVVDFTFDVLDVFNGPMRAMLQMSTGLYRQEGTTVSWSNIRLSLSFDRMEEFPSINTGDCSTIASDAPCV